MRLTAGDRGRLRRFIKANKIKPLHLAETAGISRQHLGRLRDGQAEPTRPMMVWLTIAAAQILKRRVSVSDLFDLGDEP